jgi:LPXTG-motif cell wall-anchored protein
MMRAGYFLTALVTAGWLLIPAGADGQTTNPMAQIHTVDFPYCCPRPTWWDDVEMDRRIGSVGEFSAVWQDQSLTKEQKAKAMFRAIEEFRLSNDDIVAPSITYFRSVAGSYSHLRELYEYGVATYIDFDRSLENYGGEVGDLSAGMVNTLARLYLAEGEPERAVPILRYILEVREAEVNDHLLEFAALHLGNALNQTGRGPEAIEVLLAARRDYEGDWEARLDDQLVQVRGTMGLSYYLHDTRLSLPALGGALILALGGLIFWRRRRG